MTAPRHIARYSPDNTASDADGRLRSPSFERNFTPIRDALRPYLDGATGTVLEIGSGTGQHIAHLAGEFADLCWVPSDIDPLLPQREVVLAAGDCARILAAHVVPAAALFGVVSHWFSPAAGRPP